MHMGAGAEGSYRTFARLGESNLGGVRLRFFKLQLGRSAHPHLASPEAIHTSAQGVPAWALAWRLCMCVRACVRVWV